MLREE
jgi:hypothetical protein